MIGRGIDLQVLPALIAAALAVVIGWLRDRNRVLLALGLGVAAWWVVVVAMTMDGYPGLERFYLPAAALTCVLGGVGIVMLAQLAGGLLSRFRFAATAVAAAVLIAICIPFTTTRISEARADFPAASQAVRSSISSVKRSPRSAATTACSRVSRASRRSTTAFRPRSRGSCT